MGSNVFGSRSNVCCAVPYKPTALDAPNSAGYQRDLDGRTTA